MTTQTPRTPVVGGLIDNATPWVGGRCTVELQNNEPASPYCARPGDPDKLMKVFKAATKPLDMKYDGSNNMDYGLTTFGFLVHQHLETHGMDSVFYFVKDGMEYNLITHFPLFELREIEEATQAMTDSFDKDNLKWSRQFLFDSLSMEQQLKIAKHLRPGMNGPTLWMTIVLENQSDSYRALREVQRELEDMVLTAYPGEDVKACTRDIDMKCKRLEAASSLPKDVGTTVCNILTQSSVEAFRIPFHAKFCELDRKPSCYTYQDLIKDADALYLSLVAAKKWLPQASQDENVLSGLIAKVDELILNRSKSQNEVRQTRQTGSMTCWTCGKEGHISSRCPSRSERNENRPVYQSWKTVVPKGGEEQKKAVEGRNWIWCGCCGRWNVTHGTAEHRGQSKTRAAPQSNLADDDSDLASNLSTRGL
jgi:hypothetical protein